MNPQTTAPRQRGTAPTLTPNQRLRELVKAKINLMIAADLRAQKSSDEWNRRSIELNELIAAKGLNWSQRRLERERDPELTDHFSAWSFHERDMKRHAAAIEAIKASRQLLGADIQIPTT